MSKLSKADGCVGRFNILWGFKYSHKMYPRRPTFGGVDSEPTGEVVIAYDVYHVVAPSEAIARAWYDLDRPAHAYELVGEPKPILVVDRVA